MTGLDILMRMAEEKTCSGVGASALDAAGLCYLATPYSKYDLGLESAFEDASRLAARLLLSGVKVYSPIAHTHPLAKYGSIDPLDHSIWLPFDETMMGKCDTLVVAEMSGWHRSRGIAHEIKFFTDCQKPIFYLDPETLKVSTTPCVSALREAS